MRTITAIFDDRTAAEAARERLATAGIARDQIALRAEVVQSSGHRAGGRRSGTQRGVLGDYFDPRTGRRLMEGAGSPRGSLGDYLDGRSGRRLMEGAGSKRGALGDYLDGASGKRLMAGAGSKRGSFGDYIDAQTGKRLMEGAGSKRSPLGDYVDASGKWLAAGAGNPRGPFGDYLDSSGQRLMHDAGSRRGPLGDYLDQYGRPLMHGAGSSRGPLGDYIDHGTGHRLMGDAGSDRTATGDFVGEGPGHVGSEFAVRPAPEREQRRQSCVLTARVVEDDIDRIVDLIESDRATDVDVHVTSWRNEGWCPAPSAVDMGSRGPFRPPEPTPQQIAPRDTRSAHSGRSESASREPADPAG